MALFAPMPSASESNATVTNSGLRARLRKTNLRSDRNVPKSWFPSLILLARRPAFRLPCHIKHLRKGSVPIRSRCRNRLSESERCRPSRWVSWNKNSIAAPDRTDRVPGRDKTPAHGDLVLLRRTPRLPHETISPNAQESRASPGRPGKPSLKRCPKHQ